MKALRFCCFALVMLAIGVDVAHAQAAAPPSSPPDLAALWPMIGLVIAAMWGYGARWFTATKWATAHNVIGHLAVTLIGMLISSATPIFQSGHVTWAALAWAAVGVVPTFLAGLNLPAGGAPRVATAVVLPLLLVPMLLVSGCSLLQGKKAPEYSTMTAMAGAAGAAAAQLPPICEGQENAAVDAATSKDAAIAAAGAVHARCKTTLAILRGTEDGLVSSRDAIHDAPSGADLSALLPWVRLVVRQYCDAAPLLSDFKIKLPSFPGVC